MKNTVILRYLKRDGWLLAAIGLCVVLCLLADKGSSQAPSEEEHISSVLSRVKGAGQVEVSVYYEDAIPTGALIVADGAGDVAVRLRLTSALTSLLGLDEERIAVFERQKEE